MEDGQTEDHSNIPEIDPARTAFFFDFDGTLAAIVDDPEQVSVSAEVLDALERLYRISGGALAVVSGRPIEALDRFLSPLKLPLSGVHGLEWRDARGHLRRAEYDAAELHELTAEITAFAAGHTGLIAEHKPGSVALHYRQRPDLAEPVLRFADRLAAGHPDAVLMRGKMVIETRLGGRSKADAVADFMATEPFRGRTPLFAGDDVTDEDAFRFVEAVGGIGIKVGGGDTAAGMRAPDREAFESWLREIAADDYAAAAFSGGLIRPVATWADARNRAPATDVTAAANPGA